LGPGATTTALTPEGDAEKEDMTLWIVIGAAVALVVIALLLKNKG